MGLYIQIHSMHGLIRPQNPEIAKNVDTGGQVVYVLELAKALGRLKKVDRIDLITRRITDQNFPGYSKHFERVDDKFSIVRIDCGPPGYIEKVNLWPHIDEFVENTKKYIKKIRRKPDILQSNYADSGLVCSKLSEELEVPYVHTGHSLGRPKMRGLRVSKKNFDEMNAVFHFDSRLSAEEKIIETASAIIVSTREEFINQYKGYKLGKNKEKFRFVPPGINLEKFRPPDKNPLSAKQKKNRQYFQNLLNQNLKDPERPIITALSRLNKVKNLDGLILAFAEDKNLRSEANLVIFAKTLEAGPLGQRLINRISRIIRKYGLYENVLLPAISLDYEKQVPDYYRFVAERKGVFVNPSLVEPFGLTVLEASACGVPVVATRNGGPSEIIRDGDTGLLINPNDHEDIANKIKAIISDRALWTKLSKNEAKSIRKRFSWDICAKNYLRVFLECQKAVKAGKKNQR